ncbi:MAG TPA: hypothetical protein VFC51_16570 [Chloroflexota bacterium]|nr:hypothetical protein [Chloroflexota bacterium]
MQSIRIILAATAAAVGVVGGWIAYSSASPVSLAQTAPPLPLPQNSVCYLVGNGENPAAGAVLHTDNFGNDFVGIGRLVLMCEGAAKYAPTPAGGPPANLAPPSDDQATVSACYVVNEDQANRRSKPYRLTTRNFQGDTVWAGNAVLMCEQATKVPLTVPVGSTQPPQPPTDITPPTNPYVAECFLAREGKTINQPFTLVTRNFGPDTMSVVRSTFLCESAAKLRLTAAGNTTTVTGLANREVEECFAVLGGDEPAKYVALDTANFGVDVVSVRRAVFMCERAEKAPRFIFPTPMSNPAAALASITITRGEGVSGDE